MARKTEVVVKRSDSRKEEPEKEAPVRKLKIEINPEKIEESIQQAVQKVQYWYKQGVIHKVRLKHKGKPILPDIPLSYFMAFQVATFFLTGIVRALAMNLGAKVFFEVEIINDAEEQLKKAKELYLEGELDEAIEKLESVIDLDNSYAEAYLYLGIIHKIRKEPEEAQRYFLRAQKLDPAGKSGVEASRNLKKLMPPRSDRD